MISKVSKLKVRIALFLVLLFGSFNTATSQYIPPPIHLPIENRLQQTISWCWLAVSQQIISYLTGPLNTPSQCALAGTALRLGSEVCCYTPTCSVQPGTLQQIAELISLYGGGYSNMMFSKDPYVVYGILSQGHPIIMAIQRGRGVGHVAVIKGMAWVPSLYGGMEPVLYINDPMSYLPQTIPYSQAAYYWAAGLEVFF